MAVVPSMMIGRGDFRMEEIEGLKQKYLEEQSVLQEEWLAVLQEGGSVVDELNSYKKDWIPPGFTKNEYTIARQVSRSARIMSALIETNRCIG